MQLLSSFINILNYTDANKPCTLLSDKRSVILFKNKILDILKCFN